MTENKQSRSTRQKRQIMDYLKQHEDQHLKAEDILAGLEALDEKVSKATVYRYLKVLEEEGKIRRYTLSDKAPACYQYAQGNPECRSHYHLMCKNCGEISHIESPQINSFIDEAFANEGFSIDVGKTVFYGLCRKCKE